MIKDDRVLKLELDLIKAKMDEIEVYVDKILNEKESVESRLLKLEACNDYEPPEAA